MVQWTYAVMIHLPCTMDSDISATVQRICLKLYRYIPWVNISRLLFSPLDLRSNGLMASLFVRRPLSAVRHKQRYLRNCSVNFFETLQDHKLGQYLQTEILFF